MKGEKKWRTLKSLITVAKQSARILFITIVKIILTVVIIAHAALAVVVLKNLHREFWMSSMKLTFQNLPLPEKFVY